MAAHADIMRDVHLNHQQIVIANGREHAAALGTAMNRHKFAYSWLRCPMRVQERSP